MVLPISLLLCLCLVAGIVPSPSLAAEGPSCLLSNLPSLSGSYDLSPLSDVQLIEDTKKTPPTETTSRVRFKLCGGEGEGVGKEEGVDDEDQCPPNTFVCLQIQNTSPKSTPPLRTLEVIPIAGDNIPSIDLPLETKWQRIGVKCPEGSPKKDKCFDLVATMKGGSYNGEPQSLSLTLVCSSNPDSPKFVSYVDNVLSLRWESPDACPSSGDGGPPPSQGGKGGGMGFFGWLFLLLLIGPPIYLGLGIYHNRTTYDARGWDALPHREFWREFPSLVHDLASHLIGGITGSRRSSGGGGASTSTGRGGYESL